jgi:hypothetical protein
MLIFTYDVPPDENGMVNGLDLAAHLIAQAVRLINPYVHKCPACLDAVFSCLAENELEKVHALMRLKHKDDGTAMLYCFARGDEKDEIIREHLAAQQPAVYELINAGSGCEAVEHH